MYNAALRKARNEEKLNLEKRSRELKYLESQGLLNPENLSAARQSLIANLKKYKNNYDGLQNILSEIPLQITNYAGVPQNVSRSNTLFSNNPNIRYTNNSKKLKTNRKKYSNVAKVIIKKLDDIILKLNKKPFKNTVIEAGKIIVELNNLIKKTQIEFAQNLQSRILEGIKANQYLYNKKNLGSEMRELNVPTIQLYTKIINTLKPGANNRPPVNFPVIVDMDGWLMAYNKKAMNKNIQSQLTSIERNITPTNASVEDVRRGLRNIAALVTGLDRAPTTVAE